MKSQNFVFLIIACAALGTGLFATKTGQQPALAREQQGTTKSAPSHEPKPNHIFNEMIPLLLQKTHVPLRLPEYVPYSDDKETPLYTILQTADEDNYSIQLAWDKDCEGGNACHVGYIGGSKAPPARPQRTVAPVILRGGIKGSLVGFDCGAHCDDASLDWSEGGYYYGISLKAGDKKTLVRMANSAIATATKK